MKLGIVLICWGTGLILIRGVSPETIPTDPLELIVWAVIYFGSALTIIALGIRKIVKRLRRGNREE